MNGIRRAAAAAAVSAIFGCVMIVLAASPVMAQGGYTVEKNDGDYILCKNNESGYEVLIDDEADLFTDSEAENLIDNMIGCSNGGYVLLVTTNNNGYGDAFDYCMNYYRSLIPEESGILFLIDMDTRELRFYSEGAYKRELTNSIMNIISDNIYKLASNGDYYGCANEAFSEISDVLEGKRIAAPMKYISNACLAILLGLIINYFIARGLSKATKPSDASLINATFNRFSFSDPQVKFLHESRKYSPRSSGSGGGGGGGGGGHSSGGHSF